MAPLSKGAGVKQRLDIALVERNLIASREKAQALILAGKVSIDGQRASKPGQAVTSASELSVIEQSRYVSRGGFKLEEALRRFFVIVNEKICYDIGTSTGGFTDCLLQHGAKRVHAVDTGAGQIDWKLRSDNRVVLHERINARYLTLEETGEPAEIVVCDVSFISVTLILPALIPLLVENGDMVILIKPQFEVGRDQVGKGGIVRDPALHAFACERVATALANADFHTELVDSPILGMEGNREFLLHARRLSATPASFGTPHKVS